MPVAAASGLLVAGGALGPPFQTALWALALLVDYAGIWLAGTSGWRLTSPRHFAERHGLIVIVALGESLVAIGVGVSGQPVSWPVVAAPVLGIVVAVSLWWLYFDVVAPVAERALAGVPLVALYAGVAVHLLGHVAFRGRNVGSWNPHRTAVALALLLLLPARLPALGPPPARRRGRHRRRPGAAARPGAAPAVRVAAGNPGVVRRDGERGVPPRRRPRAADAPDPGRGRWPAQGGAVDAAATGRLDSMSDTAQTLARLVVELAGIDMTGAPPPGSPGFVRGLPLVGRDAGFREALSRCDGLVDVRRVAGGWDDALAAAAWSGPSVWLHADLIPGNLLVRGGRLSAVIDFGAIATGDPPEA